MSDQPGRTTHWRGYEHETAEFFRTLGLDAETDVRLSGTRASHNIDVVVSGVFAGFSLLWLVECKFWKRRISMEKVLAFRSIVDDVGADRGILIAEDGYQSGSFEAASNTNVIATSLAELRTQTEPYLRERALASLLHRHDDLEKRLRNLMVFENVPGHSSWSRTRSLSGSGDVFGLAGHVAFVAVGLKDARLGNFPTVFGAELRDGKEHFLRSRSLAEFVADLAERLTTLEGLVGESEEGVRRGPDAHLLSEG